MKKIILPPVAPGADWHHDPRLPVQAPALPVTHRHRLLLAHPEHHRELGHLDGAVRITDKLQIGILHGIFELKLKGRVVYENMTLKSSITANLVQNSLDWVVKRPQGQTGVHLWGVPCPQVFPNCPESDQLCPVLRLHDALRDSLHEELGLGEVRRVGGEIAGH